MIAHMTRAARGTAIPSIIAHRGASGHAPENSLEAFRLAQLLGADGVELDLQATADGGLLVHHDPMVPGFGDIASLTLEQLSQVRLPNGEAIPTLAEVMAAVPALDIWIEVKGLDPQWDASLLALIDRDPAPRRCAIHSFDHRIVARLGRARPGLRTGVLSTSYLLDPVGQLAGTGAAMLWQEHHLIDQALVDIVAAAGVGIIAWTVNDPLEAGRLRSLGVAGLCGDYPEHLRVS